MVLARNVLVLACLLLAGSFPGCDAAMLDPAGDVPGGMAARRPGDPARVGAAGPGATSGAGREVVAGRPARLTRADAVARAREALAQSVLARHGEFDLISVRLTSLAEAGPDEGGDIPVWEVVFAGDGSAWMRAGGDGPVRGDGRGGRIVVVGRIKMAFRADTGEQVLETVTATGLDFGLPLEARSGTVQEDGDDISGRLLVREEGGERLRVLLPVGIEARRVDPLTGVETPLAYDRIPVLPAGTPVRLQGLVTQREEFLAYRLRAEIPAPLAP